MAVALTKIAATKSDLLATIRQDRLALTDWLDTVNHALEAAQPALTATEEWTNNAWSI